MALLFATALPRYRGATIIRLAPRFKTSTRISCIAVESWGDYYEISILCQIILRRPRLGPHPFLLHPLWLLNLISKMAYRVTERRKGGEQQSIGFHYLSWIYSKKRDCVCGQRRHLLITERVYEVVQNCRTIQRRWMRMSLCMRVQYSWLRM